MSIPVMRCAILPYPKDDVELTTSERKICASLEVTPFGLVDEILRAQADSPTLRYYDGSSLERFMNSIGSRPHIERSDEPSVWRKPGQ